MNPEVYEENGREYFRCPGCGRGLILDWDVDNHKVIYPKQCDLCSYPLVWDRTLSSLEPKDEYIEGLKKKAEEKKEEKN